MTTTMTIYAYKHAPPTIVDASSFSALTRWFHAQLAELCLHHGVSAAAVLGAADNKTRDVATIRRTLADALRTSWRQTHGKPLFFEFNNNGNNRFENPLSLHMTAYFLGCDHSTVIYMTKKTRREVALTNGNQPVRQEQS